jgi:hypothetical protein
MTSLLLRRRLQSALPTFDDVQYCVDGLSSRDAGVQRENVLTLVAALSHREAPGLLVLLRGAASASDAAETAFAASERLCAIAAPAPPKGKKQSGGSSGSSASPSSSALPACLCLARLFDIGDEVLDELEATTLAALAPSASSVLALCSIAFDLSTTRPEDAPTGGFFGPVDLTKDDLLSELARLPVNGLAYAGGTRGMALRDAALLALSLVARVVSRALKAVSEGSAATGAATAAAADSAAKAKRERWGPVVAAVAAETARALEQVMARERGAAGAAASFFAGRDADASVWRVSTLVRTCSFFSSPLLDLSRHFLATPQPPSSVSSSSSSSSSALPTPPLMPILMEASEACIARVADRSKSLPEWAQGVLQAALTVAANLTHDNDAGCEAMKGPGLNSAFEMFCSCARAQRGRRGSADESESEAEALLGSGDSSTLFDSTLLLLSLLINCVETHAGNRAVLGDHGCDQVAAFFVSKIPADVLARLQHAGSGGAAEVEFGWSAEDLLLASSATLLMGCLMRGSPANARRVQERVPGGSVVLLMQVLEAFLAFQEDAGVLAKDVMDKVLGVMNELRELALGQRAAASAGRSAPAPSARQAATLLAQASRRVASRAAEPQPPQPQPQPLHLQQPPPQQQQLKQQRAPSGAALDKAAGSKSQGMAKLGRGAEAAAAGKLPSGMAAAATNLPSKAGAPKSGSVRGASLPDDLDSSSSDDAPPLATAVKHHPSKKQPSDNAKASDSSALAAGEGTGQMGKPAATKLSPSKAASPARRKAAALPDDLDSPGDDDDGGEAPARPPRKSQALAPGRMAAVPAEPVPKGGLAKQSSGKELEGGRAAKPPPKSGLPEDPGSSGVAAAAKQPSKGRARQSARGASLPDDLDSSGSDDAPPRAAAVMHPSKKQPSEQLKASAPSALASDKDSASKDKVAAPGSPPNKAAPSSPARRKAAAPSSPARRKAAALPDELDSPAAGKKPSQQEAPRRSPRKAQDKVAAPGSPPNKAAPSSPARRKAAAPSSPAHRKAAAPSSPARRKVAALPDELDSPAAGKQPSQQEAPRRSPRKALAQSPSRRAVVPAEPEPATGRAKRAPGSELAGPPAPKPEAGRAQSPRKGGLPDEPGSSSPEDAPPAKKAKSSPAASRAMAGDESRDSKARQDSCDNKDNTAPPRSPPRALLGKSPKKESAPPPLLAKPKSVVRAGGRVLGLEDVI